MLMFLTLKSHKEQVQTDFDHLFGKPAILSKSRGEGMGWCPIFGLKRKVAQ